MSLKEIIAAMEDNVVLEVKSEKIVRNIGDFNTETMRSQLSYIISGPCYFGQVKTIDDCFNPRIVDDGILFYKELGSARYPNVVLYYWLAYFGGNPTGYLLVPSESCLSNREFDHWQVLIENCDTDFIWRGNGKVPKAFIKSIKMAVYGSKYDEEDNG